MVEFAQNLDRLLELLIIRQPAAHLANLLAAYADLTRAVARIGHYQHENLMAFAARAFGTISGVSDRAFSPVIGNLPTSFWRARMVWFRIIHQHDSDAASSVNPQIRSSLQIFAFRRILAPLQPVRILRRKVASLAPCWTPYAPATTGVLAVSI